VGKISTQNEVSKIALVFSAVGNSVRFKILMLVNETQRPLHIKAVAKILKMDYAAVYRHVKILEKSGLLGIYEVGRSRVLYLKNAELVRQIVELAKIMLQKL
jgi:ArsR family transcriptional regulator